MRAITSWVMQFLEYAMLGLAIGCFGMYAYESVEARRYQAEQAAVFARAADARHLPGQGEAADRLFGAFARVVEEFAQARP